ncbi:MAG: T9SS type A sorting domain-containing protein, partial [Chitinophagaceae bacterium]|nr:T9SS type A sorting domain-containing protein [Chitinophagaceae bacterium]
SNKTDYSWVERVTVGNPHTLPHNLDISFLLYPNPFINWFYVNVNSSVAAKMQVSLYNISGQLVANKQQTVQAGVSTIKLEIENIPLGIYTVVVSSNGHTHFTQKLVKQ